METNKVRFVKDKLGWTRVTSLKFLLERWELSYIAENVSRYCIIEKLYDPKIKNFVIRNDNNLNW